MYCQISGTSAELQELVHSAVHVHVHPAVPVLLGRQPQPGLDLLLHWDSHRVQRRPHLTVNPVGEGNGGRSVT